MDRQLRRCGRLGLYMYMETYVSVYIDDLQTNFRPDTRQNITKQNRTEAKTDNKSKVRGMQVVQVVQVMVVVQVVRG